MGIAVAVCLWLTGVIAEWILPGIVGGAISFVLMVMALPVMPILGMPAVGGSNRLLLAMALSATLWWIIGQVVATRVAQRPVVGWREWLKEFVTLSLGLWIGAAMALALGALALGAL
jgi:flagellar biosynthesis protein FliR